MTERLYYADPYQARFSARVIERISFDGAPAVILDRTAFYPTSGGQPADRGTIDDVDVVDVVVREADGAIIHVTSDPVAAESVTGEIDWPRRFDHMQQHTGQHILSAAFERLLEIDTVGFHLGADVTTIDLTTADLDWPTVYPIEDRVNQIVWADRAVETRQVERRALADLPLRRLPDLTGPVRLVEIAEFDLNPCGGTHVARTGEIGLIKVVGLEKRGDQTRVSFVCGGRALGDYRAKDQVIAQLTARLTVGYWELDEAVDRLEAEAKASRHDLRKAKDVLRGYEVEHLAEDASARDGIAVVRQVWSGRGPDELRALAQELRERGAIALLAGVEGHAHLCFAAPDDVDVDVASMLKQACAQLGGGGGGHRTFAQGGAPEDDEEMVAAVLEDAASTLEELE